MKELAMAHKARREIYSFFGLSMYKELTSEALESLPVILNALKALNDLIQNEQFSKGVKIFEDFLHKAEETDDKGALLNEIATIYATLFLVPTHIPDKTTPYPYESLYTGKHKMIMDDPRDEVYKAYRLAGFNLQQESNEPEDHIGLELLFMARLAERMAENLEEKANKGYSSIAEDLETSIKFLKEHPLAFIDRLSNLVEKETEHSFFQGIAFMLPAFLRFDLAYLEAARPEGDSKN